MKQSIRSLLDTWHFSDAKQKTLISLFSIGLLSAVLISIIRGAYRRALGIIIALALMEGIASRLIAVLSKRLSYIIREQTPAITPEILDRFFDHGFDPELGWIRKPNTSKVDLGKPYRIDSRGSRANPGHEGLPAEISVYGDSYAFCREVEDNETWPWYMSEVTGRGVLNFGVGNYGFDQALLRLEREYDRNPSPVVIMGVVPSTIQRILSVWKHYNEYENIMAFKPRFILENDELTLVPNIINERNKFFEIDKYLPEIQKHDYFYRVNYKREAFRFPYALSCLVHYQKALLLIPKLAQRFFRKNSKMERALQAYIHSRLQNYPINLSVRLFQDGDIVKLLAKLVERYVCFAEKKRFRAVLVILPMKDDLAFIRDEHHFYKDFLEEMKLKHQDELLVIDTAPSLLQAGDMDHIFNTSHYNAVGNNIVAARIVDELCLAVKCNIMSFNVGSKA